MGLRLYLARHGRTAWNAGRRLQGSTDVPLDDLGLTQAAALRERVLGLRLDHIYTSALTRSRQTAAVLEGVAPMTSTAELNERALGRWEGRFLDTPEVLAEYRRRIATPGDDLDGGESLEQHRARVTRLLGVLRERHAGETILAVGHGATNAQLMCIALGLAAERAPQIRMANDELFFLDLPNLGETLAGGAPIPVRLWRYAPADELGT